MIVSVNLRRMSLGISANLFINEIKPNLNALYLLEIFL
jgi:hypothetical protein